MARILLFILGLLVMVHSELEIISMDHDESDILKEGFKKELPVDKDSKKLKKIKVQFNYYTQETEKEVKCMMGVSLSLQQGLLAQAKGFDFFFTTCLKDVPVSEKNNIVFIGVPSVAYVVQNSKMPIFAIFMTDVKTCLQRKYTDDKWVMLKEPEQLLLTREQCLEAVDQQMPKLKTQEIIDEHDPAEKSDELYITAIHGVIPKNYKQDPTKGNVYVQEALSVTEDIYRGPKHECLRVIGLWLNKDQMGDPEEHLLDFQTNCYNLGYDLIVSYDKDLININGVAYVYTKKEEPVWAVYVAMDKSCVMQIYTDNNWNKIQDAEMNFDSLTKTQCQKVIESRNPGDIRSTSTASTAQIKPSDKQTNPQPTNGSKIKLIALGDNVGEGFALDERGEDNSINGDLMINSIVLRHQDQRCVRGVSFFLLLAGLEEQHLDDFQLTCDAEYKVSVLGDVSLVSIADVVYVRAETGQEVFAIFMAADGACLFRKYTDKSWTTLGQKMDLTITEKQCREVIISGNVNNILPPELDGSKAPKPDEDEMIFSPPPPNSAGQEKASNPSEGTIDKIIAILKRFKTELGNLIVKINPFSKKP